MDDRKKNHKFYFLCIFLILIVTLEARENLPRTRHRRQGHNVVPGNLASLKCIDYVNQACNSSLTPGARITGGIEVPDRKMFPFVALLGSPRKAEEISCGATLISDSYIVTAAHCVRTNPKWVRLGNFNLTSDWVHDPVGLRDILEVVIHPGYNASDGQDCDIALLRVDPLKFTEYVRPACLKPTHLLSSNQKFTVVGWGATAENASTSENPRYAEISMQDNNLCTQSLTSSFNSSTMLCAGTSSGGLDTCQGDSGGPLLMKVTNPPSGCTAHLWILAGVTSKGKGCGRPGVPGSYTKISSFIGWIEGIVWK